MKKFFYLFVLACAIFSNKAQTSNIILTPDTTTPPVYKALGNVFAPNGTTLHSTFHGVFFVDAVDLMGIPTSTSALNSLGFALTPSLCIYPANGILTFYISNTTDFSYQKGNDWNNAISNMTQVYTGTYNIPTGSVQTSVDFPFSSNFSYTGNSLYVAFSYTGTTFDSLIVPKVGAGYYGSFHPSAPSVSLGVVSDFSNNFDVTMMKNMMPRPLFRICLAGNSAGINEIITENNNLKIYPNPIKDKFTLRLNEGEKAESIEVIDFNGKLMKKLNCMVNNKEYDLSELPDGVYLMKIRWNGNTSIKRFSKISE
ncbi:MAG: T9SS type A sorting domain-containing protein [Bacteroidia bacterium]|nr:T9SS type A sorting domain-containing protein [Bacteroidia bacterium]